MMESINPDWDGTMKARARAPTSFRMQYQAQGPPPADALAHALDYAKRIIESYQMDLRNSDWTGVNLVEKGFCQGIIYQEALATIDRIARDELVV